MGLCKCPKRRVTNQFCFEHRVNVCEWCMIDKHPACVVQSYLVWLNDSDYSPNCSLCQESLDANDCNDPVIRLVCYHVVHWRCLVKACVSEASSSAATWLCPICQDRVLPDPRLQSPVADRLRHFLAARADLADDDELGRHVANSMGKRGPPDGNVDGNEVVDRSEMKMSKDEAIVRIASDSEMARSSSGFDPDDDKYKRKSLSENLGLFCFFVLAVISFMALMSWLSRNGQDDPMLEPMSNPNIRVAET